MLSQVLGADFTWTWKVARDARAAPAPPWQKSNELTVIGSMLESWVERHWTQA